MCQFAGIETAAPILLAVDIGVFKSSTGDAVCPEVDGVYCGSRYPADPATTAIYDFLPDGLLARVENRDDFWNLIVIDLWLGNPRASKALFYRTAHRSQVHRSASLFRLTCDLILRPQAEPIEVMLPKHAIRHYGEGGANRSRRADHLLALNASDIKSLFDDFPQAMVGRFGLLIDEVAQNLVEEREAIFMCLPAMLRAMQHQVDAAESARKGPCTEVTSSALNLLFDHKFGATA